MINLSELDDLAFDLILSHLRYIDLYNLSLANRALRSIVANASLRTLNCTKVYSVPLQLLPYAAEQRLLDQPDWRVMAYNKGNRREDVHLCQLYWTSRHNHFNSISLRNVILDGTRINVLDIIHFVTAAPHLEYLSVRFCIEVHRLLLQNFLDTLSTKSPISLERLDVLGIDGIPFFEPLNNGSFAFNETEIELTGAGPEFDYQDRWREDMYDFRMSLERVPTSHGQRIMSDIARCSQSYCRNFNLGRQELADPTIYETLPTCIICQAEWTLPICRPCITARSCKLCKTFICPRCYNIDNDIELHDFGTSQRWMQSLTNDLARGGKMVARNCREDIETCCADAAKAALMMQLTHRHMSARETAQACLSEGFL